MHMSRLTRRTQLLLDENRYARLEQRAAQSGRSVAAIIREAIDDKLADPGASSRRRAAAEGLLAGAAPSGGPEPDWSEVKDDLRGRGA
jgi:plasmid stability protein